jgi:hypothetical protein
VIAMHVPNPITFTNENAHIPAPFAAFKLLEALAPALVADGFSCVPGGLRLDDARVDLILHPAAAGLEDVSDLVAADYIDRHAVSLVVITDNPMGMMADVICAHEGRLVRMTGLRPWFHVDASSLQLVQTGLPGDGGWVEAFIVAPNRPAWRTKLLLSCERDLRRGLEDAHVLADLWRDVVAGSVAA